MHSKEFSIDSVLAALHIESLNPMQQATLDATAVHDQVLILSATGTGKTIAFLLPILKSLQQPVTTTQAVIVVPSRELALQIETVFKKMRTGVKITSCVGGHKREIEENNLLQAPGVIVGTPGRLGDHLRRGNIKTESVHTLVMDEYDKSLETGFTEEVNFIAERLSGAQKRILTSATEAAELPSFIDPAALHKLDFLTGAEAKPDVLEFRMLRCEEKDKLETLFRLLCQLGDRSTIIFCNHRDAVERTSEFLADKGIINTYYHGALEQPEREVALARFRNGSSNFLVTTDLASRGLDIPNIRYIIHYHLPPNEDVFTHRNGRTARMEASGTVILLLGPGEKLPEYIGEPVTEINAPAGELPPAKPKWTTLFISAGKKQKVNKVDIVGFLANKGDLRKEDIGLIEVKDFFSFAAVRKSRASQVLQQVKDHKLKNQKVKIAVAK